MKIFGFQKIGFVKLVTLGVMQGAKEERNSAGHVFDKLVVFFGEGGGTALEPGICLRLGMSDKAVQKSEDILQSFLCHVKYMDPSLFFMCIMM